MKNLLKKHRMLSVGIFLAAVLSIIYAAILSPAGKNTGSFSEFCTTLFREEMKSNTMNLHFTLKDPKAAGIDSYEITLGSLITLEAPLPDDFCRFLNANEEEKT